MRSIFKVLTIGMICTLMNSCNGQSKKNNKENKAHLCTMMGNLVASDSLIGESSLLWKKKKVQVYFLDDDGNIRDLVLRIANSWMPYSGVQFIKSYDQNSSDIRVSFRSRGWWSYIGSDCLAIGKDSVTLSLDNLYLYSPEKIKSVVLHEFGHSIGLLHEHQHPFLEIEWDLPALYSYYKETYNVDSTWVDQNVLEKYSSLSGIYCEPDLKSIMIYEIPSKLTKNHVTVKEPLVLSELDKKYIKYMYTDTPCK